MFDLGNQKPFRARVHNRYAGDHPRSFRYERHAALEQRQQMRRRVDRRIVTEAIAEAFEDHADLGINVPGCGGIVEGEGFTLIYGNNGRLLAACAG